MGSGNNLWIYFSLLSKSKPLQSATNRFNHLLFPTGFVGFNSGTINPLTFCVTAQYQWVYLSCYQSKQEEQWIRCFLLIDIPIRIRISIENGIYFIICISHNIVRIGSCIIPIVFLITVRLSSFISEIIRNFEGFHVFKNLQ